MNNDESDGNYYIIKAVQTIKDELVEMIDYVQEVYNYDAQVLPYQELRYNLIVRNIDKVITGLKSILASIPYAIYKTKNEGLFHSNVHVILKILGFEIISEEITNNGRIDAVIRFAETIYILEFKFNKNNEDLSEQAYQQILDKRYAEKFHFDNKEMYLIGISFSEPERNINGYKHSRYHL